MALTTAEWQALWSLISRTLVSADFLLCCCYNLSFSLQPGLQTGFSIGLGFPDSSSAFNAWDPSSIPGSGRSIGEGIGYPLQYSWASLVAQLVKNPPAMWETWVQFLGWEYPLEKGKATHSSILAWRIPWTVSSMGSQRVRHWATFTLGQLLPLRRCFSLNFMFSAVSLLFFLSFFKF